MAISNKSMMGLNSSAQENNSFQMPSMSYGGASAPMAGGSNYSGSNLVANGSGSGSNFGNYTPSGAESDNGGGFSLFGKPNENGEMGASPLMQGMQTLTGLGSLYMGMKQYGLARDGFAESKRQYNQNYAAQKTLTNGQLEDRQRARVASNPGAYESVGSYMKNRQVA